MVGYKIQSIFLPGHVIIFHSHILWSVTSSVAEKELTPNIEVSCCTTYHIYFMSINAFALCAVSQ